MAKSDFDIGDQVAFDSDGRKVGRITALGSQATVQIWNTGDFEVGYAKLTLTKKKSRRKSPSKKTRALRTQTGSATAVAEKAEPKTEERRAAKKSWAEKQAAKHAASAAKRPKRKASKKSWAEKQTAKYSAALPEEGFDMFAGMDLGTAPKKKGRRKAKAEKKKGTRKEQPKTAKDVGRLLAKGGGEKQAVRQWIEAIPSLNADGAFAALTDYREFAGTASQFNENAYLEVLTILEEHNWPVAKKRTGKRKLREIEPMSRGAAAEEINRVSASLLIHKKDRPSVRAIAERLIADAGGFSENLVQAAAVIHFGARKDGPKFIQRMDKATINRFFSKYAIRSGKILTKADIVKAGGNVKLKKFGMSKTFADYVRKTWGGWENFVWFIWPEFYLSTKKQKADFRDLGLSDAEKFITKFESTLAYKAVPHTVGSAFEAAMDKVEGRKREKREERPMTPGTEKWSPDRRSAYADKAGERRDKLRAMELRLHRIGESAEAIQNPADWEDVLRVWREAGFSASERGALESYYRDFMFGRLPVEAMIKAEIAFAKSPKRKGYKPSAAAKRLFQSNPPKRKGKRAKPANRRKMRRGLHVEWVDRRGVKHQGIVDRVHAQSSTVISSRTMKYSEQANRDLYPFTPNGYNSRRPARRMRQGRR